MLNPDHDLRDKIAFKLGYNPFDCLMRVTSRVEGKPSRVLFHAPDGKTIPIIRETEELQSKVKVYTWKMESST